MQLTEQPRTFGPIRLCGSACANSAKRQQNYAKCLFSCGIHCPALPPWPLCQRTRGSAASCHFNVLLHWYFLLDKQQVAALCFLELQMLCQQQLLLDKSWLEILLHVSTRTQTPGYLFRPSYSSVCCHAYTTLLIQLVTWVWFSRVLDSVRLASSTAYATIVSKP